MTAAQELAPKQISQRAAAWREQSYSQQEQSKQQDWPIFGQPIEQAT